MADLSLRLAGSSNGVSAAARRRQPARCSPASGPTSPSTRCRSRRSPTACTPAPGPRRRWPRSTSGPSATTGPRPRPRAGRRSSRCPTASCGPPAATAGSGWWPTPAAACARPCVKRGASESQAAWTDEVLDPEILTIGFARRFATYKRATLLFRDLDRLKALLLDEERPGPARVRRQGPPGRRPGQGAAPAGGHARLRPRPAPPPRAARGLRHHRRPHAGAAASTCGSTPRCGRSRRAAPRGMKAVFNGVLNCSVLDGWWDEMYDGDVGLGHPLGRVAGRHRGPQRPRGGQPVQPARAPGRAALLQPRRRRPARPTGSRKVKASMSRVGPQVERQPHAARVHRPTCTSPPPPAPATCAPTTTPGPRPWCGGAATSTAAGRRWRSPAPPTRSCPAPRAPPTGSPPRCRSAISTRATSTCSCSTAPSTSTTTCATPPSRAMIEDGDGDQPGLASLHASTSTSTGPATSASPCASCRAHRRPAQLRLPGQGGLGAPHRRPGRARAGVSVSRPGYRPPGCRPRS